MTEKERSLAKFQAKQAERMAARKPVKKQRSATRGEQHERYIDAGPQAWDNISEGN